MDLAKFAVRENTPFRTFFVALINLSKTCTDKNRIETPTIEGKANQQKRHSAKSALKNGGVENFDGARCSVVSLFIRVNTGNFATFRLILWILDTPLYKMFLRIKKGKNIPIPYTAKQEKSSEYGNKFEGKMSRSIMKYYLIIIYNYMLIFI